ncbi:MAG: RNA methyltransferase [Patescibacteria group bacterium]
MQQKRLDRIATVVQQRRNDVVVVLEDIHDPHNSAAILRTCDAMGIQNVHFIFEKEKQFNPKRIGKASSSSANKWLDFTIFHSVLSCFKTLKREGYTIIATALTPQAENLNQALFNEEKIALLVGNEHSGLSQTAIKLSDRIIMIPMKGFVQSFNVSVSTALVLWDIFSKRKMSPLGKTEQKKLIEEFSKR